METDDDKQKFEVEKKKNNFIYSRILSGKRALLWRRLPELMLPCLLWLMAFQPLHVKADPIEADVNAAASQRPQVEAAANGVPLVNIVSPNEVGLSHNQYTRFDVETSGAILNNSTEELSRSQLGGLVQGNSNLSGSGSASVILNEVTSTRQSVLQGALEIHGSAADVIVANPNGLTCNGCGFINTPRVTLSTGVPEFSAEGALSALQVESGDIEIGSRGAAMQAIDIFNLVSCQIRVEGPVVAGGDFNLLAGRNRYFYATGEITPLESDGNEPEWAIESTLLGGMSAGKIKIISNEKGAGVHMQGQMAANADEMTLSADGKLILGNARAKKKLHAQSLASSVEVDAALYSETSIELQGHSSLQLQDNALVLAAEDVLLKGESIDLGQGALAASGVDEQGMQSKQGILTVEASILNAGNGQLAGGERLQVNAITIDLSRDSDTGTNTLSSLGELSMETNQIIGTNARVSAQETLNIQSTHALSLQEGTYLSGGTLTMAGNSLSTSAHLIANDTITLQGNTGSVTNSGTITGNTNVSLKATTDLSNTGSLASQGNLTIALDGDLSNTGSILSQGVMTLTGLTTEALGHLTTESESTINGAAGLTIQATDLTNAGTIGSSGGQLDVELASFLLNQGLLYSGTSVHFRVDGSFTNTDAEVLAEGDLIIEGLSGTHSGALTNSSGTIGAITGDLTLKVASLLNERSTLTIEQTSTTETTTEGSSTTTVVTTTDTVSEISPAAQLYAGGNLIVETEEFVNRHSQINANGDITIQASSASNFGLSVEKTVETTIETQHSNTNCVVWLFLNTCMFWETEYRTETEINTDIDVLDSIKGTISAAGEVSVTLDGNLENNANGQIIGNSGVSLTASSLENAGQVAALDGSFSATMTGNVKNTGSLASNNTHAISLAGNLTNSGSILSAGTMTLTGLNDGFMGHLMNESESIINGGSGLTIKANGLTNKGGIGSSNGALKLELTNNLMNQGLLYSGTYSRFKLDGTFTNDEADVLAETNLTVEGLNGSRAGALTNTSGTIEAVSGDMTLKVDSLFNQRPTLTIEQTVESEETVTSQIGTVDERTTTVTQVETTTDIITENSLPAHIFAGGNILINTESVTNSYSQIAANGNITFQADSVDNIGENLEEVIETTLVTTGERRNCLARVLFGWCHIWGNWYSVNESQPLATNSNIIDAVFGTIEAGGVIYGTVDGYLENNARREGAPPMDLDSGEADLEEADLEANEVQGIEDASEITSSNLASSSLDLSIESYLGRSALFNTQPSPQSPYLIETRPEFIDPSQYLGSDYFLNNVGMDDPEHTLKRLGDSYVETRLIRDQLFELTGKRYLGDENNEILQMQALYDNAIELSENLQLTPGVALTPSQIASLTQDIIWMEQQSIQGQQVLVPRLYLSQVTLENLDIASAQILGSKTILQAAELRNSGSIVGSEWLGIQTTDGVFNLGGGLFSEGNLFIETGGMLTNRSGTISGGDVNITAAAILNETAVTRDEFETGYMDRIHQQAVIEATGDLNFNAATSIYSIGGMFSSGGNSTLTAGEDIHITSQQVQSKQHQELHGGHHNIDSLSHTLATVNAGGELTMQAGGELGLHGVNVEAGDDITLTSVGDTTITSVQDYHSDDFEYESHSSGLFGLFGSKKEEVRIDKKVTTQRTTIKTDGELTIASGEGNIELDAVSLKSGGQTSLSAEQGQIAFRANKDSSIEQDYERDESLLWFSEEAEGHQKETIEHVEIEQGGGLKIHAGKGVVVEHLQGESLDETLDQLTQNPELEWMNQLRDEPNVDWQGVDAAFNEWDYQTQGLTQAGAALLSLAVTLATGGVVGDLSSMIANGMGITNSAVQTAINAGLQTLTNQAAVAFVNNQGDLAATLEQLGSDASLQAVLSSMLTAGLTTQFTEMTGLGADLPKDAPLTQRITQDIQQGIVESTVEAGVTSAVYGEDFGDAFVTSLRSKAAETLGEHFAEGIGSAVEDGDMDTAGQMIAHAALGCAMGSIASDDCASGAAGAVIGETVGLLYAEKIKEWAQDAKNGTLDKEEVFNLLEKMKDDGVNIAKLASGFAVALGGGDVNLAAMTGGNAAENNALELVLMYLIYADNPRAEGSPWKIWIDIGEGKDPISQMMEKGTTAAVEWSASEFPEETEAVLNVLETIGTKVDAVITYVDEATGKTISKNWNELDTDERNILKGTGKITSFFVPAASVKNLNDLIKLGKIPNGLDSPKNIDPKSGVHSSTPVGYHGFSPSNFSVAPKTGEVKRWGPATGKGPLNADVVKTFRGGSYSEIVTSEATTLYRVHGGNAGSLGPYWSRTKPAGPLQSQVDNALNPAWGNTATEVTTIRIPKGTKIYEGAAAPQGNLLGGGNQVYVLEVNPEWVVP